MRRREWVALAAILALAAGLRMLWPGVTEFKQDEAHLYALALDLAELKAFPLRGISSSVGVPNAPLSVYLFALPLFVWPSPLAATLFTGLLNTASVGLGYALARRYWGPRAALASAVLYAAAPWAVLYSRKIWAQNLLPLFVVAYAGAALLAFVEGRQRWLLVHLLLLALIIQIHLSGLALAPVTLTLLFVFRRQVSGRWLAYGLGAAALALLPLGVYALTRVGELRGALEPALAWLRRPAAISADALELARMVMLGTQVRGLAGPRAFRAFEATFPNLDVVGWAGGLLIAAGAVLAARRALGGGPRRPNARAGVLVLLWLALPILFFVRHSTPVYSHYFILLFPAPYLLAGLALDAPLARWRVLWLLPVGLAAAQAALVIALLRFIGTQATPGAFGTPLKMLLETAAAARALGAPEVIVAAEGSEPGVDLAPAVFDALLRDTPHRFVDARTTAVIPAAGAAVVIWPAANRAAWPLANLYQGWGGGHWDRVVALRAGEGQAWVTAGASERPRAPTPRLASALLANGVEVLGTGAIAGGWQLWWQAPGPLPGEAYHLFVHLIAADGQRLGQVDAPTYPAEDWRPGDLVVSHFALPAGGAAVRVGMYAYPSLAPVPVLDAAGDPAGEWLEFER
ncbi:MAG: glycosyltransferase family 39 protein [Anaerolineales bacterium]|nr:glycosyltransferase family 39 protein [Anaerolineales bacterium]